MSSFDERIKRNIDESVNSIKTPRPDILAVVGRASRLRARTRTLSLGGVMFALGLR